MTLAENAKQIVTVDPDRSSKLECLILSILLCHKGQFEEALSEWVMALRIALPKESVRTIQRAFIRLWEQGMIELSTSAGRYRGRAEDDEIFFSTQHLRTSLTTVGRMVLEMPKTSDAGRLSATTPDGAAPDLLDRHGHSLQSPKLCSREQN